MEALSHGLRSCELCTQMETQKSRNRLPGRWTPFVKSFLFSPPVGLGGGDTPNYANEDLLTQAAFVMWILVDRCE